MKRGFNRRDPLVDLGIGRIPLHVPDIGMAPGVVADGVAEACNPSHHFRVLGGVPADHEECGEHAFMRERGQNFGRGAGPRPVVEGQHHFVVLQRQRLRKTLQADARRGSGIDGENA